VVENGVLGQFLFKESTKTSAGTVLYEQHLMRTGKNRMADFAGYLMPLWFSSISIEHKAVRKSAGLFDCTHMGILEFEGEYAQNFLDAIATNNIKTLKIGCAKYSYILDAAGFVLDDIIIYRRKENNFMVVVNAANKTKIQAWLKALQNYEAIIDTEEPSRKLEYKPVIRDMLTESGSDCRVDLALQGPASKELLFSMIETEEDKQQFQNLKSFNLIETKLGSINCIISTTGYTGSKIGYELFVHPSKAAEIWALLLERGESLNIVPCGLGARDSLRIEAGLPLYGHELDGKFNINPFEAGYSWAVKLEKDFFIGQAAMQKKSKDYNMQVARIEFPGQGGIRPIRQPDGVLDEAGHCVGWILSCAKVDEKQIALAYISRKIAQENRQIGMYYIARSKMQAEKGKKIKVEKNQKLEADISGTLVTRFAKF
jgi:glycine cleavage system T protein